MSELDQWMLWAYLPAAAGCFLLGIDDLLIDAIAWIGRIGPAKLSRTELARIGALPERRMAIMVASWREKGVLSRMIKGNQASIRYTHFDFFLGVYPNDTDAEGGGTVEEAFALARENPRVHVVVNSLAGPTSKGQMVNQIVQGVLAYERETGARFDAFVIHDSEDVIHPESLKLFNWKLDSADFVQIPVFSLPVPLTGAVAGTYVDEFAEFHTKDILVRNRLGAAIPSAGVGTALSRALVFKYLLAQSGRLLNERSLTEDYELGALTCSRGFRSAFACYVIRDEWDQPEFIATREYFPRSLVRSIRQKSRWTLGIAFQGATHVGWPGGWVNRLFLYRDRKGPWSNLLSAYCLFLLLASCLFGLQRESQSMAHWLAIVLSINLALMANRVFQRGWCVARVYGMWQAWASMFRVPVGQLINACAALQAIRQSFEERWLGIEPRWLKTEHELPVGFGVETGGEPWNQRAG